MLYQKYYFTTQRKGPLRADNERRRTRSRLSELVSIDCLFEVGSTAVEGVIGKQDLDFLVRVKSSDFPSVRNALDQVFTTNADQKSNHQYQGYCVESEPDVAIQLTIEDGPYNNFLTFLAIRIECCTDRLKSRHFAAIP